MQDTIIIDQAIEKPSDYEKAVDEGLRTLEKLQLRTELNQLETARMREETNVIAERIREIFKTF